MGNIPIIIGVTGHRDLREKDIPLLRKTVRAEVKKIKTEYPHSPLVMLSSLAAGADTLCAEVALELGILLKCPLPMDADEYRADFAGADLIAFNAMLKKADEAFAVPYTEPAPAEKSRDFCYRQAGIYVASHSHVLLALWDGSSAKSEGCGTAEAVGFMLKGGYRGESCFKAVNDGAVIHIVTPRQNTSVELSVSTRLIENEPGSLREALGMTDSFNADSEAGANEDNSADALLPGIHAEGATLNALRTVHGQADRLSLHYQGEYIRAIKWFSVFGMLLVLSFLLYDELESNLFLLCYGILILVYVFVFLLVRKNKCHMKYLQYRILSETSRVQFYLTAADTRINIGNAFTWTQKQEATWVKEAVSALLIGTSAKNNIPAEMIKTAWIDGQLAYHKKALTRDLRKRRFNERCARWMLICSVALFAAVLMLELLFGPAMTWSIFSERLPTVFMQHSDQTFALRSLLKIILGGISAITIFLTNYFGKLSFERKSTDHEKMARLYTDAKAIYEQGQTCPETLFMELAREEIIETGNWFSYCQENTPSFNL